jgi:hypothetical protein
MAEISTLKGLDEEKLIGRIHAALLEDFNTHNRKNTTDTKAQPFAQRVRKIVKAKRMIKESGVVLGDVGAHGMGTLLKTPKGLTFLPDPSLHWEPFGSEPDPDTIERDAPDWGLLKLRTQETKTGALGGRTHYCLAHLLNHQVNGSGKDARNVVPFDQVSNHEMAINVESKLKKLVQNGIPVQYTVALGSPVGMTPGRKIALRLCENSIQREIIKAESRLPSTMTIDLSAYSAEDGSWVPIVSGYVLTNHVPETVPVLRGSPPKLDKRGKKRSSFEPDSEDDMFEEGQEESPTKKARTEPYEPDSEPDSMITDEQESAT